MYLSNMTVDVSIIASIAKWGMIAGYTSVMPLVIAILFVNRDIQDEAGFGIILFLLITGLTIFVSSTIVAFLTYAVLKTKQKAHMETTYKWVARILLTIYWIFIIILILVAPAWK